MPIAVLTPLPYNALADTQCVAAPHAASVPSQCRSGMYEGMKRLRHARGGCTRCADGEPVPGAIVMLPSVAWERAHATVAASDVSQGRHRDPYSEQSVGGGPAGGGALAPA
jgi:hypothetical protein